MKHFFSKYLFLSGAVTAIFMSCIIFSPQKVFASVVVENLYNGTFSASADDGMVCAYKSLLYSDADGIRNNGTSLGGYTGYTTFNFDADPGYWYVVDVVDSGTPGLGCESSHLYYSTVFQFDWVFSSHFISFTPSGGSLIATSTATTTGFVFYINPSYWTENGENLFYTYQLSRFDNKQALIPVYHSGSGVKLSVSSGINAFSTSSSLLNEGKYQFYVSVSRNYTGFYGFVIGGYEQIMASSSVFYVGSVATSTYGSVMQTLNDRMEAIFASSTLDLGISCSPLSSGFNVGDCAVGFFVPSREALNDDLTLLKQVPPWGYAFRAYDIFSSPSSSSLPVFDATVPSGVVGSGSHIALDLNHSLDYILTATSGNFVSGFATSTKSFYEITSIYWNILVYLLFGFYIIRRLVSKHLIPSFKL